MVSGLGWSDILLRVGLAAVTGASVGINRGQRGRAAGLRTMLLVCTSASLAMLLANWLWLKEGGGTGEPSATPARFVQGIMAGVGFLGAGTILRKGNIIRGVTTAASIWYVTVLGLCFGIGYWQVGLLGWGLMMVALLVLPYVEFHIHEDRYSIVRVLTRNLETDASEVCRKLQAEGLAIENLAIDFDVAQHTRAISCRVRYHVRRQLDLPPRVIDELSRLPGIVEVRWK